MLPSTSQASASGSSASPLVSAESVRHGAGHVIEGHAHAEGQLLLVLSGTATITAQQGFWLTPPGLGVWIPPGTGHGARYSESSALINLRFAPALCSGLSQQCVLISISDLLRELAQETIRVSHLPAETATLNLMAQLMVQQARHRWQGRGLFVPHGQDRRLRQAISILRAHPGSDIQLEQLAQRSATSSRTLARLFAAETGMSFRRWRDYFRVACAIDLLAQGRSITQTALQLGYQSASSFTTLFTRLLGHPPKRYMQLLSGEQALSSASTEPSPPPLKPDDE